MGVLVRIIFPALVFISLVSCARQDTSDMLLSNFIGISPVSLTPESTIDLEQYGILLPTKVFRYMDSFIIRLSQSKNFVDILTSDGDIIHCVNLGRGPEELLDVGSVQVQDDTLFVYGINQRKLLVIDLPGTIEAKKQKMLEERIIGNPKQSISGQTAIPCYLQTYRGRIYATGLFEDGYLYAQLSQEGELVSGVPRPDLADSGTSDLWRMELNGDTIMSISPDGTKVAVAYSGIAAISMGNTQPFLAERWSTIFFQPKLFFSEQYNIVGYDKENVSTFHGIQTTDDVVILIYSGKDRTVSGENDISHCNHLLVFDWDGHPLMRYDLDVPIVGFCIDDDKLYGISYYPAAKLYDFGKINLEDWLSR